MPKQSCSCSQCKNPLKRWLINPNTNQPIKNFFCDTTCKGQWQVEQRESLGFTKEWLIDQYITQGKDANKIGKEIGRNGHSVWNWMIGYGIQTRPRGHDESRLVKDGSNWIGRKHKDDTKEKIKQARINDGHVPYLKNGEHWLKGVAKENHPNWKGGFTPDRQSFYASEEWSEAVKSVWKRDNATCQLCGVSHNKKEKRGTFHIHHIVSFMVSELRSELSNLVLLCKECHLFIHSKKNTTKQLIKEIKNVN